MKITFSQANKATRVINEKCKDVRGDLALLLYFVKHNINQAFEPYNEQVRDHQNEFQKAQQEKEKSKGDPKAVEALNKQMQFLNNEVDRLSNKEEEVTLSKGKIALSDLKEKNLDTVEVLSALDFAINFEKKEEAA